MKFLSILSFSIVGVLTQSRPARPPRSAAVIPTRFIIELKDPEGIAKRADGDNDVAKLYQEIAKINVTATSAVNFTSDVFFGTSAMISNKTDVEKLRKIPGVKRIWPVHQLKYEPIVGKSASKPNEKYNIHGQTGVQKLHDRGIYGQGVIIAVVDSGVDYRLPDLGGGYGPGFKIEGGWDFKGDSFGNVDRPDNDPYDDCEGHGTHVTGIIAANGTNFMGVAPQARIRVYKVMNCFNPGLTTDVLIAAQIRAYKDGADIISTSIGDEAGWPNNPWAVVSSRIAKKGVFVISAAGNSGWDGAILTSSEAAGEEVISVGATRASSLPAAEAIIRDSAGAEIKIPYLVPNAAAMPEPLPGWGSPYVRTGMKLWTPASPENTDPLNKEGCSIAGLPEWEISTELTDRVILVKPTKNCTIRAQALAGAMRDARYMLIVNDGSNPVIPQFDWSDPVITQTMITHEDGLELERRLINNETLMIRFPEGGPILNIPNLPGAGTVDTYSSWGLASDLSIKPDIAAPGSDIFSTFPSAIVPEGYFIASGTSMATPYISGIVALYLSVRGGGRSQGKGKRELRDIAQSLINSGNPVPWSDFDGKVDLKTFAPVAQQGGGLIDAVKFVNSKVLFSPQKLALNHTGNFQGTAKITVTNTGTQTLTFNVTHQPGASFYVYGEDHLSIETQYPDDVLRDKAATVKFDTSLLKIAPGAKKSVKIDFKAPTGFTDRRVPIYGGHIAFRGSDGNDFFVPFSGMAIDGKTIYEPGSQGGEFWLATTQETILAPTTIDLKQDSIVADFDLHFPVREATLELILNSTYTSPATFKLPRVPGENGFVGTLAESFGLGRTTAYRPPERLFPTRSLLDGRSIPNGTYRYVIKIWKPFYEDRNALASWSYTISPPITIIN